MQNSERRAVLAYEPDEFLSSLITDAPSLPLPDCKTAVRCLTKSSACSSNAARFRIN
jgi:hypothetical protein